MLEARNHGGARPGSGPKRTWRTPGPMTTVRVPALLLPQLRDLARQLDTGAPVLYDEDTNARAVREAMAVLTAELAYLAVDRKRKARHSTVRAALAALEHYQARVERVDEFKKGGGP